MKQSTIYLIMGAAFLLIMVVIYYLYTKKQTEIAQRRLELESMQSSTQRTSVLDLVGALGTGLSGLFNKSNTTSTSTPTTTTVPKLSISPQAQQTLTNYANS